MSTPFLRPEATAWIKRWREPLAAGAAAGLGVWWVIGGTGILAWVGAVLALAGAAAAIASLQRARFRSEGGGVGVVQLVEGQLAYFGPLTGGTLAVSEVTSVAIDPHHRPAHWVLRSRDEELRIPVNAEGADILFDVFARLPGLDPSRAIAARDADVPTTLWRRDGVVPKDRRLH